MICNLKVLVINIPTFVDAYINQTYATNFLHSQNQKTKKMVYNVAFLDHVIRMVNGPLYWRIFVRKDFASMASGKGVVVHGISPC